MMKRNAFSASRVYSERIAEAYFIMLEDKARFAEGWPGIDIVAGLGRKISGEND